jgi:hypothetical protein
MSWPPPLAMLATELPHVLSDEETARVLSILGAYGKSTIGELPEAPRTVIHRILRLAKERKRKRPRALR